MYDFLNNFHKRMEKLSYSFLIDSKVSTLTTFKDYFTSLELINLVYSLMCFVLDRSLKDEECTLNRMTVLLAELAANYYDRVLTEDEAHEITRFIVYKILRNDGKPFVFTTIDYNSGEKKAFDFHLLQQKTSKADKNKSTFMLTQEGYRLLLGALEVDEKTQIDINQIILELSLKKKNFSQGLLAVENLSNLITAQINVLNNFIYQTRENIFSIEQKAFEDNFLKNIAVLREQNKKFDELKEIIIIEEERLAKTQGEITQENYDSLKQLARIKEFLTAISFKAGELINRHFYFKEEYLRALEESGYYYSHKRINLKEDLIKPIERDASKLGRVYELFNPLFNSSVPKKFNINYMFNEQKLYLRDDDDDDVLISDEPGQDLELVMRQKNKEDYRGIISSLFSFLVNNNDTDLKSMINYYEHSSQDDYHQLVPSVRKFSEVFIELLRIGSIEIGEMLREQERTYDNEEIEFDLRSLLVDEINAKHRLLTCNLLTFSRSAERERVTVSEQKTAEPGADFITVETLSCPNIIMKLE
ncbi:MAG TPA: hypothetical protein VFC74_06785 [Oscillospiraceae bacterium]|nr:hypothetical protein [Oscillospiraceae bacterium]